MGTDYTQESAEIYSDEIEVDVLSLRPIVIELISEVKGKKILDFGCGSGRFSKLLAENNEVIAIDNSKFQIELAEKINSHQNIKYLIGNEEKLKEFNNYFDFVLMNMVLPSFDNKESATFKEVARVLSKTGKLVISTLHPLFLTPINRVNERVTDFDFKKYFDEGHIYSSEAITTKGRIMKFRETHFSLDFISKILESNGLIIKRIKEGKRFFEKGVFVPIYIVLECVR